MRESPQKAPDKKAHHSEPARAPAPIESAVLAAPGLTLDALGNRATLALLRSGRLQRKARVSQRGDPLERDADRAADAVVSETRVPAVRRGAVTDVQRVGTEEQALANALGLGSERADAPAPAAPEERASADADPIEHLYGGEPLDERTRGVMESRFAESFSDVRIHTGYTAANTADAVHSRAFTVGSDIVFAEGEFAPDTTNGRRLLAHELAHVVQQRQPTGPIAGEKEAERDARDAAHEVTYGGTPAVRERAVRGTVQKASLQEVPTVADATIGRGTTSTLDWDISAGGFDVVTAYDVPSGQTPNSQAWEDTDTNVLYVDPGTGGRSSKTGHGRWNDVKITSGRPADRPVAPPQPKPKPKPAPRSTKTKPKEEPPPQVVPETVIGPEVDPPTTEAPKKEVDPKQGTPAKGEPAEPSPEVAARLKTIRANLQSFTFNPWWDQEIVRAFRESSPAEFQQLQATLGEAGMNEVFDQLNPFFASIVGSLGPVTAGKSKLTEKRIEWLLEVSRWGPNQRSFMYYWLFTTMQTDDIGLLLGELAAQSHLHDTVYTQPGMKEYLATRGIDLDMYPETPLGFWRGAGRGLKGIGRSIGESIPAANAPNFGYESLPEPYRSESLASASKDFSDRLTPRQIMQGAASDVTLGFSDIPLGIVGGAQAAWEGGTDILSGKPGEGAEKLTPVVVMVLAALAGRKLAKLGAASRAEAEASALLGPSARPPGAGGVLFEVRATGRTAAGLDRFMIRHASGEFFELVVHPETGSGYVTHIRTGRTAIVEGGQIVSGSPGLLPEKAGGTLPFDPFGRPGGLTVTPAVPSINAPPEFLLPPRGTQPSPPLLGGGTPAGRAADPLLLPWAGTPKLLMPPPATGGPLLGPPIGPLSPLVSTVPTPPPGMTAKEMREASTILRHRPNGKPLPEKAGAYDGTDGGVETYDYHIDDVKSGQPIIVIGKTISGADAISLKELDIPDVAHVVSNVRDAINKAYTGPSQPKRGWTPVPGTTDVYFRTTVKEPKKLTIIISVPGAVTEEMKAAAQAAVTQDLKYLELPPIEVIVEPMP